MSLPPQDMPKDTPPAESPLKGKTGLRRIVNAFFNSLAGLQAAWRHESAFRQEIALACVLLPVAFAVPMPGVERALLAASVLLVIVVELLNSSVEAAIDRISLDHHPLSGRAKDIGSAAVFFALVLLGVVWACVLPARVLALL
jgi:diacylglycerol kinase (ATP)